MIGIIKNYNTDNYPTYTIKTPTGFFLITYDNTGDLFFHCFYLGNHEEAPDNITFNITKENYFLYQLFLELYTSIKNNTPYINSIYDYEFKNNILPPYLSNPQNLFHNNIVDWYDDDTPSDYASRLIIEKAKESIKITFTKNTNPNDYTLYTVRIRNSGSRYTPYNITFMNLYQKLERYPYNYPYHQIHIEEYLYNQKRKKRKLN